MKSTSNKAFFPISETQKNPSKSILKILTKFNIYTQKNRKTFTKQLNVPLTLKPNFAVTSLIVKENNKKIKKQLFIFPVSDLRHKLVFLFF